MGSLTCVFIILGCISVIYSQRLPARCAAVLCQAAECPNPVRPRGECCSLCPGRPNCALVDCRHLRCANQYTPPGQCCPVCTTPPVDVKPGRCPRVRRDRLGTCVEECSSDYSCPGTQKCCSNGCGHVCRRPRRGGRPNCRRVDCPHLRCANQYTPPGECCPVCRPPTGTPNCRRVDCPHLRCVNQYTPQGDCCPVCRPPTGKVDCRLVRCAAVHCIGQYTPRGQCCPVCPPTGY